MAVVEQPIEDGSGHHLVAEDLVPFLHRPVGADQHAALLVTPGDQLEEQVPGLGFKRQVAQFIDDCQMSIRLMGGVNQVDR